MKTNLGFGLFDVLIKGKMQKKPDTLFMSELVDYSKEKKIELFLITGLDKEKGEELIKKYGIDSYFSQKNTHYIDEKYYDGLTEIDRELKKQAKEKDPNYSDEYYKVYFFNNLYNGPKEKTLFVGHDIWTDAYYLSKYSNIDVVLLKDTISNNHAPSLVDIKDLHIITPTIDVFKEYLEKEKSFNYSYLNNYANKTLYQEMFGKSLFDSKLSVGKILDKSHSKVVLQKKEEEI
jgi:hypothetical protein